MYLSRKRVDYRWQGESYSPYSSPTTPSNLLPVLLADCCKFARYHFSHGHGLLRGMLDFAIFRRSPGRFYTKLDYSENYGEERTGRSEALLISWPLPSYPVSLWES